MLEQGQAKPKKVTLKKAPVAVPAHLAAILALRQQKSEQQEVQQVDKAAKPVEAPTSDNSTYVDTKGMFKQKNRLEPDSERSLIAVNWDKYGQLVLKFDDGEKLTTDPVPVNVVSSAVIVNGGSSDSSVNTFETVSKNLDSNDCTYTYTDGVLTQINYLNGVVKALNYTADVLTSVVLSGSTPAGIELTKTFTYQDDNLVGATYS